MIDAHCHFHFPEVLEAAVEFLEEQSAEYQCVCNGTQPEDWEDVAELADRFEGVTPAFGVHPWQVKDAAEIEGTMELLRETLKRHPSAQVGEIGLDRWIEGYDIDLQIQWFIAQLALAAELKRPATIHCLKAWGQLRKVLASADLPKTFLIHAYSGPRELIRTLVDVGAYFSFSTYFLGESQVKKRAVFEHIPIERILVETDAPSMCPKVEVSGRQVVSGGHNHPGNLDLAYAGLAEFRGLGVVELHQIVEDNFCRFCAG
ncbi:MAG: TatD family hydrolase [Opitutales bacterium]|nr:TatD family hydrolase [Opitutales bacterium]NRA25872.1 TatD family hydrolase [Opitutales bacterium]